MSRKDIEFQTTDNLTLRGWLYTPSTNPTNKTKLPCMILIHGSAGLKEFALDKVAEAFVTNLPLACLVYDYRSFGSSDTAPGQPQFEIIPSLQISDLQDAITYVQGLGNIDADRIGIRGQCRGGFSRLIRPGIMASMNEMFTNDRLARAAGQAAATILVTDSNPLVPSCLPSTEAHAFYIGYEAKLDNGKWKNQVTIRSIEAGRAYNAFHMIESISPTPLLMVVAKYDYAAPTDIALSVFNKALEPKRLVLVECSHFDIYSGESFEYSVEKDIEFLR